MSSAQPKKSQPTAPLMRNLTPSTPQSPHLTCTFPTTPGTPMRSEDIKNQFPDQSELLLAMTVESLDDCSASRSDIKRKLNDMLDRIVEAEGYGSPTPGGEENSPVRVRKSLVLRVPRYVEYLRKGFKKRTIPRGSDCGESPKKKRKNIALAVDPTNFEEESDPDDISTASKALCSYG